MSDLQRMRKLAGILNEGVMAIPGMGQEMGNDSSSDQLDNPMAQQEGIELGDHEIDEPHWFVIDAGGTVCAGPYDDQQQAQSDTSRLRWYDPMKFSIEYGIDDDGQFVSSEGDRAMDEEVGMGDDPIVQQTMDEMNHMVDNFVDVDKMIDTITQRLMAQGYSDTDVAEIFSAVDAKMQADVNQGISTVDADYNQGMMEESKLMDSRTADRLKKEVADKKWAYHKAEDDKETETKEVEESFDLNNGYNDVDYADGNDFFPDGADSPVVSATGAAGARHGDNPEQKKISIAETHKELVYNYRNFLKESAKK